MAVPEDQKAYILLGEESITNMRSSGKTAIEQTRPFVQEKSRKGR